MQKIRFKLSNEIFEVDMFPIIKDGVKRLKISFQTEHVPDIELLKTGFVELNEHNEVIQGDFSNYINIYKSEDNGLTFILSNIEGDTYTEPEIVEPIIPTEPYIPTLDEIRAIKINDLSTICNHMIINGVDIEIDDTIEHFSYTESDQTNIKELFDTVSYTGMPMYYHADDLGCKLYSVNQIISIYTTQVKNKTHHLTYFNQLKLYINNLTDKETIEKIEYGTTELTGEYLETYKAAMIQAEENVLYLLSRVSA